MAPALIVKHRSELARFAIGPQDTVEQIYLTGLEDGTDTSVCYGVRDPQGVQPDNSHADSVEISAGDVLVLPRGSVHRIQNLSDTERMYVVTVMANDPGSMENGFARLACAGVPTPWTPRTSTPS